MVVLMLVLGLIVLTLGAELLVRGASRLAIAIGISPLVVGLTVVAYGTSALGGTSTQWNCVAGTSSLREDSHPEASMP